ncbi:MAG: Ribosomal large subunit pseudouridine synthase D [Chlamydiae bacterium]|nr:Ribosomal large subunit pseudouridine synthase D [Chlamydiota bacterium]
MTPETDLLVVEKEGEGVRLDKFLSTRFPDYSRQYFQYLIETHLVLVNGQIAKKRTKLIEGDEIEIEFALTKEISLTPEPIPLTILYEDEEMLAVNKPAGMVVHPAAGNWTGTFVHALLYYCQTLPSQETLRPGIVHRLDKETSGVLLAAKTERAQQGLVEAFANQKVKKEYLAICVGNPGNRLIEGNIGRHPTKRKQMSLREEGGKEASTECLSLGTYENLSFVRLFPKTGRTHQLRVHLQSVGTPILGDSVYGIPSQNKKWGSERQLLHAASLQFPHPITEKSIEVKAPIPDDMREFTKRF